MDQGARIIVFRTKRFLQGWEKSYSEHTFYFRGAVMLAPRP